MREFNIDLYLWYEPAGTWLFIPPYPSSLDWRIKLTRAELLLCEAGLIFRVDKHYWLGNEMDSLPFEMVFFELENTLNESFNNGEIVGRLPISEYLATEFKSDSHGNMTLSRYSTRERDDYFEEVAHFVGSYYQGIVVKKRLWQEAVNAALNGMAVVFSRSDKSTIASEFKVLERRLIERFERLK